MNKAKRLLAALLCGCILFATACSSPGSPSGSGDSLTPGRYVEKEISPAPEESLLLFPQGGDALTAFSEDYARMWTSADAGESWSEETSPLAGHGYDYVGRATLMEDGSLIAYVYTLDESDPENPTTTDALMRFAPDGSVTEVTIPEMAALQSEGKEVHVMSAQSLGGERLLLNIYWSEPDEQPVGNADGEDEEAEGSAGISMGSGDSGQILGVYNATTGEKIFDLGDIYAEGVAWDSENLYVLENNLVSAYSLESGARLEEIGSFTVTEEMSFYTGFGMDAEGDFYKADNTGLYKLSAGEVTTVMNGTAHSFGDSGLGVERVIPVSGGRFVMNLYKDDGTYQMLRYDWDPDASYDPDKTLKIWSLQDSPTIRAAIAAFRKANPDALVEYEIALDAESGLEATDAIKNLNVEILNGTGPDIIVLDGTPMDSYVKQGVLADLSSLVDTDGLYRELVAGLGENARYYLPSSFKLPGMVGDAEDYAGLDSLEALVDYVTGRPAVDAAVVDPTTAWSALPKDEQPAFEFSNLEELFDVLWDASSSEIIKDGELDTAALTRFLTALDAISRHYNLGAIDPTQAASAVMGFYAGGSSTGFLTGSTLSYLMGRARLGAYTVDSLTILATVGEESDAQLTSLPGLAEGAWVPLGMVGINAKSDRQEFAASFITTLLSDEVQGARTEGLPVSRAGMQKQIDSYNDLMAEYAELYDDPYIPFGFDIDGTIAGLKAPSLSDAELTDKIYNSAVEMCQGKLDVEGCVKQIEQEVKNYLAERQ